jgi:hypothetical protein
MIQMLDELVKISISLAHEIVDVEDDWQMINTKEDTLSSAEIDSPKQQKRSRST